MPTLLEMQSAISRCLITGAPCDLREYIVEDGISREARLSIYRNTRLGTLTNALRLAYPAVHGLVGAEFFDAAAQVFTEEQPAGSAYLNEYGEEFPDFLDRFPPVAPLRYLPDVARLDWAVNRALHAPNREGLDPNALNEVAPERWDRVVFTAHPSVGFLESDFPVDRIWRGVLFPETLALESVDLTSGKVWLIVQRVEGQTRVDRMAAPAWRFAQQLCAPQPLGLAMEGLADQEILTCLAENLAAGRFVGFQIDLSAI